MAISALVFWPYLCWVCALLSLADTVVYLDRPGPVNNLGDTLFEPYFNPKSVRATVGERIHFVARFRNIQNSLRTNFLPFEWAFAESDYTAPCIYNQGADGFFEALTVGTFSGYFNIDPQGTWNGSSFTFTVSDTAPHFYYMVSNWFYIDNCSALGGYQPSFNLPANNDVIFALNPSSDKTFEGYKNNLVARVNYSMTFAYSPQGGQLQIESPDQCAACVSTSTPTPTPTPTVNPTSSNSSVEQDKAYGCSQGALSGGVTGAAVGGLILGALGFWGLSKLSAKRKDKAPRYLGNHEQVGRLDSTYSMSEHTTNLGGRLGDENIVKGGGLNVVGIQL